ncbi:helix-turn-helix domain-containing protein [Microcoleus sp. MON1_C5]|uniref:helix-turn-helix domain-containing protein n=1 Tax=Microcoleus sp. MON1_C5 TaxID=2818828 RepID=UPI002FD79EA9
MIRERLPVYTIHDVALSTPAKAFEVIGLEEAFTLGKRNVFSAHRHDYYEVFWITQGSGTIAIDFTDYEIRPATLCFLSPGQVHAWTIAEPIVGYLLSFTGEFFLTGVQDPNELAEMPLFYTLGDAPLIQLNDEQAETFHNLVHKIEQEYQASFLERDAMLRCYLRILLIEAKRLYSPNTTLHQFEAGFLLTKKLLALIEVHYLTTLSVAEYADLLHVTANHLNETIKRTMNKTAGEVIRARLLLEAKRLLRYSDIAISEIAYHLNFEDPSYFSRFFKKYTRLSPRDFRDLLKSSPQFEP